MVSASVGFSIFGASMPKRKSSNQLLKQRVKALEKRLGSMGLLSAALAIQVNGSARVGGFGVALKNHS